MHQYEVIIIGAGPAGYVSAIRCAQLGMKTACIDQWINDAGKPVLGGTCLNVGCIPSKALLDSSHHFMFMNDHAKGHGIHASKLKFDVSDMQKRKNKIVQILTGGVTSLLKKNKVDTYYGTASFISPTEISVKNNQETVELQAKNIVIATGSKPAPLSIAPVDNDKILDSTGALSLQDVPKKLGIIGAGVIGLEMGSVWSRLGAEVTVLEALEEFLPFTDHSIASEALKILSKQALDIRLGSLVKAVNINHDKVDVTYLMKNDENTLQVDKLVVAIGRSANTDGLDLDNANVEIDDKGFIKVDTNWQTTSENIYAIGDVIGGAMLAHKGSDEGIALAEQLAGQAGHVNYLAIPWVIYTWPEIAWVGMTEKQCKEAELDYRVGTFPFLALGRARAMGDTQGTIKIIGDAQTDRILGAHIFGPNASELISEAVVAIEADLTTEDLARTVHAHPTLAEGMHEAALAVAERAIHI